MERMEVDQCAAAAAGSGGGVLRRSNSAPMITGVRKLMSVDGLNGLVSLIILMVLSVQALPLSPFSLASERPDHKRLEESMELMLRENLQRTSRTPINETVRWPTVTPLKRKGGVESDGPPKKLFVAGVTEAPHITGYTCGAGRRGVSSRGVLGVLQPPEQPPLTLPPSLLHPPPPQYLSGECGHSSGLVQAQHHRRECCLSQSETTCRTHLGQTKWGLPLRSLCVSQSPARQLCQTQTYQATT
ncbi:hypothetical protein JZ751_024369 [Albula glossodonta]|uniref:Uncharacterized protein n=1 Tax=Albula glossodonta TaxID=121402 RepID=A0A8T2NF32_9TELE|nr:hypothetical protein JZ751_024369 [Albula glossodonta]